MVRTILLYLFADFQLTDVAGPVTAFEIASRFVATRGGEGGYRIALAAAEAGAVKSSSGLCLQAEAADDFKTIDTLIVSGGDGSQRAMLNGRDLAAVKAADRKARRTASVCSGAFVLAAAGLLDGKRATTHWRRAASFARRFPKVIADTDRIYIRQGRIWTSAGIAAGIDLALALIAEDHGEDLAKEVAQEMVVYHRRPGGQSQFSQMLDLGGADHRFSGLLTRVRQNLGEAWTVERMADEAAMSVRHFSRAFSRDVGLSPARAVERLRIEAARSPVEDGDAPIESIAREAGFGDAERMRRSFVQFFGLSPQSLRMRARAARIHGER